MHKCIFFDRDGIVNASPGPGYVERWEDFRLMPEFPRVLALVRRLGYEAVVVTNQRGVARGIMTVDEVDRIHRNLLRQLKDEHDLTLLDILYCPHGHGECDCRKPAPGMLLEAARRHDLDLLSSWMIGDNARDVEVGQRAGCRTVYVGSGEDGGADYRVSDLNALESLLSDLL